MEEKEEVKIQEAKIKQLQTKLATLMMQEEKDQNWHALGLLHHIQWELTKLTIEI